MPIIDETRCKKCNSDNIVFVEYAWDHPEHYDGVSEVDCLACGARFGLWSGKELGPDESEKRPGRQRNNAEKQDNYGPLEKTE